MPPSVGRIVHYVDREEKIEADRLGKKVQPFAAIVTAINENGSCELTVFTPHGPAYRHGVGEGPTGEANVWSWPPRV